VSGRPSGRMLQSASGRPLNSASGFRASQSQSVQNSNSNSNSQGQRPPDEEVDILQKTHTSQESFLPLVLQPQRPETGQFQSPEILVDKQRNEFVLGARVYQDVFVNVYNLNSGMVRANEMLVSRNGAFGGAFHVGIQVYGSEWTYGVYGVSREVPRSETAHVYSCSVYMGRTEMEPVALAGLFYRLCQEWRGADYDLFSKNCCSFGTMLSKELGLGPVPSWIDLLPRAIHESREAGRSALAAGVKGARVVGQQAEAVGAQAAVKGKEVASKTAQVAKDVAVAGAQAAAAGAEAAAQHAQVAAKVVHSHSKRFAEEFPGRAQAASDNVAAYGQIGKEIGANLGKKALDNVQDAYVQAKPHVQQAAIKFSGHAQDAAALLSDRAVAAWGAIRDQMQSDMSPSSDYDNESLLSPTSPKFDASPIHQPFAANFSLPTAAPVTTVAQAPVLASAPFEMPPQKVTAFHTTQSFGYVQQPPVQPISFQAAAPTVQPISIQAAAPIVQPSPAVHYRVIQSSVMPAGVQANIAAPAPLSSRYVFK